MLWNNGSILRNSFTERKTDNVRMTLPTGYFSALLCLVMLHTWFPGQMISRAGGVKHDF